ncbi:MAG: flagellar type III secretion system pore protein FliP [Clostridiales bacterium]|jgi:flagellar biosynthetic protein FliP|nr:flagellar type III secretion system pore protein FliP [Clostridiales bacterium]HOC08339.1 flagellar type III secretion system pore protein FliP [Bacillota bacterium]HQA48711.1 flagellar type III secretion system pore protein FliP [Bacillota bacterium]HQD42441.1 flagellar type III secretion system pore protein FliP [Bacillota bacterium]
MNRYKLLLPVLVLLILLVAAAEVQAAPDIPIPRIGLDLRPAETPEDVALSLQILFLLTVLSLAPAILIMTTSFTRIVIVLSFIRNALATQQTPPNQVLIGLALFLTLFVMSPVISEVNQQAFRPYMEEEIAFEEALDRAIQPLRQFMLRQTRQKDLALFVNLSGEGRVQDVNQVSNSALIPAFIISELKTAFQMGFLLFVPFLVIDMVVASTLMSMGMMMLPPVLISLPFKILLFIMVDGWNLVVQSLITGFR